MRNMKAAAESRTPKLRGSIGLRENAPASWSAAALSRFTAPCFVGLVSCITAISASAQTNQPIALAEVPLKTRNGDLLVETRINGSEQLLFKLDTGFGITTIHPNRVESLNLERVGHMTIIGIAGEEQADTYAKAVFDFGGATYTPRRIASLPSEARRRWRKRDGILGEGFFRRFVVEIDMAKQHLRLFEPKT